MDGDQSNRSSGSIGPGGKERVHSTGEPFLPFHFHWINNIVWTSDGFLRWLRNGCTESIRFDCIRDGLVDQFNYRHFNDNWNNFFRNSSLLIPLERMLSTLILNFRWWIWPPSHQSQVSSSGSMTEGHLISIFGRLQFVDIFIIIKL